MSDDKTSNGPIALVPMVDKQQHVPLEMILGPLAGIGVALTAGFTRITHAFYDKTKHEYGLRELVQIRNHGRDQLEDIHLDAHAHRINGLIADTKKFNVEGVYPDGVAAKGFEEIREQIVTELESLNIRLEKGPITDNRIWQNALRRVEDIYTQQEKNLLKIKGYETTGVGRLFKGAYQRWKHLGHDTQISIVVTSLLSAVVSFGSLFILGQNIRLRRELSDIHTSIGDQSDQTYAAKHPSEITIAEPKQDVVHSEVLPKTQVQAEQSIHHGHAAAHAHGLSA